VEEELVVGAGNAGTPGVQEQLIQEVVEEVEV
jgi:hypothetical protein